MKKLLAVAFAVTLPLAAMAQAAPAAPAAEPPKPAAAPPPLVQVYGTLNVNLMYAQAEDATVGSQADVSARWAVSADSSNVGVRGTLKATDTYSVVYQCETGANIDGDGLASLCNRNSRVGISAPWGTLAYGSWDTPFKGGHYGTKADDPFGNTDVFGYQNIMGSPGYGNRTAIFTGAFAATTAASFDNRGANSVLYWSPKVSGLSARLQWSVNEARNVAGTVEPMLLAAGVNYDMGPLSVAASAEYHEDAFGIRQINAANTSNAASKDLGWRVAAGSDLPLGVGTLNVMAMLDMLTYEQEDAPAGTAAAPAFKDYSRFAWLIGAKFRTGNHELRARYSMALDPDITAASGATLLAGAEDNLAAQNYAAGYAYHLAKSTQMYAYYSQVMNDDAARYSFTVGGPANLVGANTPAGSDPMAIGLGMRHAF